MCLSADPIFAKLLSLASRWQTLRLGIHQYALLSEQFSVVVKTLSPTFKRLILQAGDGILAPTISHGTDFHQDLSTLPMAYFAPMLHRCITGDHISHLSLHDAHEPCYHILSLCPNIVSCSIAGGHYIKDIRPPPLLLSRLLSLAIHGKLQECDWLVAPEMRQLTIVTDRLVGKTLEVVKRLLHRSGCSLTDL
ncbi:hypothetical protein HGRIS_014687 [Hohenbuehelia grisea]|uniref:Uncharacterized protein n=1 Tax=Hohenbuehelia grisea TaxID=104357 RepID=A0ABR3JWF0_9AGAR